MRATSYLHFYYKLVCCCLDYTPGSCDFIECKLGLDALDVLIQIWGPGEVLPLSTPIGVKGQSGLLYLFIPCLLPVASHKENTSESNSVLWLRGSSITLVQGVRI